MGKKFFEVMKEKKLLPKLLIPEISDLKQDSTVLANFYFSKLDSLIAMNRITILKNDWPYVVKRNNSVSFQLMDYTDSLAYFVAAGKLGWGDSHRMLAGRYLKINDIQNYKKEMEILINTFPNNLDYYDKLNEVLIIHKLYSEAFPILEKRYKKLPNAFTAKWLGYINFMNRKFKEAIKYFEINVSFSTDDPDVYFYLAGAYGREAVFDKALASIQKCLTISPDYPNGRAVLQIAEKEINKRKL
jgi:tetratricopeptide (TPR) repeat protein